MAHNAIETTNSNHHCRFFCFHQLLLIVSVVTILSRIPQPANSFAFTAATVSPSPIVDRTSSSSLAMSAITDDMNTNTKDAPFGAWDSPISSQSITAGSVGIGGLHVSPDGNGGDVVYWLEGRPQEGGRNVLCRYDPTCETKSERGAVDVTPAGINVRSRVHEYGGGATLFAATTEGSDREDSLFFTEFLSQQQFKLELGNSSGESASEAVTADQDGVGRYRYADGIYDQKRKLVITVREDHGVDGKSAPKDVVNEIVALDPTNTNNAKVLVTGSDFVAAPRLSIDGKTLAAIVWDHPNMPWDATRLVKISLPDPAEDLFSSEVGEPVVVAGQDNDTSVMQPLFHPVTGKLFYISDESGFYNIYMEDDGDEKHSILPMNVDFGGSSPGWRLGQMGYTILKDGRLAAVIKRDGSSVLIVADVVNSKPGGSNNTPVETVEYSSKDGLPMQFADVQGGTSEATKDDLYFMGGDPSTPSSVYQWNLTTKGAATILACSSTLKFDDSVISVPRQIEFPTTLGTAFGYYYPPQNGGFRCTTESAPPLLVKAHGGPTGATGTSFNAGIQYWTSRGFAVFDVDYGGSTGYGRDYRRRLRGSWGIVDIDDVCNGAKYLVGQEGLADGDRLCIDGGSAGGYTTLGALAFRDVFKAGCSLYGVGDLTALASDTHKFESRYLDGLVGKYPEDEAIYKERSPIESVDKLSCPILLLQGDEDKIVPPNQAEMMYTALKEKGIPTCLKMYEGEQHGFRKAENIEDALDSELSFYGKVFGIDVPGAIELEVDNM
uniref:Peptidase S9 prolyl oligopeptidase catalytic domain-containing protein n=1 Tax=Pseudo-nitzschia australis TaxID=44445 RepID=A0A7S4A9D8_9STRA|mmetsp:Transcript_5261/g.10103  ORF Transcript_5261/g.10103 Transcript_5261/m.10103 type:complete len:778 (+) Transcript_5261:69-2402(+)